MRSSTFKVLKVSSVPQVPVHVFLDFSTLECRHLSEALELFVLDLMDATVNYTNREVKVRYMLDLQKPYDLS